MTLASGCRDGAGPGVGQCRGFLTLPTRTPCQACRSVGQYVECRSVDQCRACRACRACRVSGCRAVCGSDGHTYYGCTGSTRRVTPPERCVTPLERARHSARTARHSTGTARSECRGCQVVSASGVKVSSQSSRFIAAGRGRLRLLSSKVDDARAMSSMTHAICERGVRDGVGDRFWGGTVSSAGSSCAT